MIFANISVHPSVDGVAYMTSEKEDDIVGAVFCPQVCWFVTFRVIKPKSTTETNTLSLWSILFYQMVAATLEDSARWREQQSNL